MTGTIRTLRVDKGFGFIKDDTGKDYFFHRTALAATLEFDRLEGGEKVTFDIEQDAKGDRARNVEPA